MHKKRAYMSLLLLSMVFALAIYTLYTLAFNSEYVAVAANQSVAKMSIYESRGTIYDRNLERITNDETNTLAVAMPVPQNVQEIQEYVDLSYEEIINSDTPIIYVSENKVESDFIDYFSTHEQYSNVGFASHIIGYNDSSGNGVVGAQRVFNSELTQGHGSLVLNYNTNAIGNIIAGTQRHYEDSLGNTTSGVALTLDQTIQSYVENIALKLGKGAVVVTSVKDNEILASASVPTYSQDNLLFAMEGENAPLLNRSFEAYAPGSIFKLVLAISALENNEVAQKDYFCSGSITVDGLKFKCYGEHMHGLVNMHSALINSCNAYFINLMQDLDVTKTLNTALLLGFGTDTEFYQNFSTATGHLPNYNDLANNRSKGNFAIGQGDVLVTPVQVAQLINTIANNGEFNKLNLYLGEVDDNKELLQYDAQREGLKVISQSVVSKIQTYMESIAERGTGEDAAPDSGICGIKTGTAQTGIYDERGEEYCNSWYAGYVGNYEPEYSIVVLNEGVVESEFKAEEVFKEVAEFLLKYN